MLKERMSMMVHVAGFVFLLISTQGLLASNSGNHAAGTQSGTQRDRTSAAPFPEVQDERVRIADFDAELAIVSDLVRDSSAKGEQLATDVYAIACQQRDPAAAAVALVQRACARMQRFGLQAGIEDYRSSILLMPPGASVSLRVLFLQGVCRFERFTGHDRYQSRLENLRRLLNHPGDEIPDHVRICGAFELLVSAGSMGEAEGDLYLPSRCLPLSSPDVQLAAFERVETIRRCLVSGQFNSREELTAVMQELPGLFDELRLSELVIHHSFVTATIAAELSLTKAEDEAIDRGLAASMLMGSETHFAQCLMRRAESLARYRPASFSATSIRSIMLAGVDAVNDRDLLRQAVEGLAFDADSESGLFAAGCLKRIESLNAIIGASANDFSIQNERHLEQIIDAQAEQILIREQAAKSASDRSAVFARIGLAMLCGLALILLRERWSLRKINVRLQEEIQCNERQRIERDRIELRLAQTERLESLGAIAGGIAHDFNNLLVGVLGNADLLRQEVSLSRSGENYLDGIVRSAETAAELSHKMLAYAGRQASTKRVLELNALLERMLPLFRAGLGNRHVIRFAPAEESLFTRADLAQIEQIVMNLVTNALQALGDRNGLIQITTGTCSFDQIPVDPMTIGNRKEGGHFVWFEVSDNGPGIPVSQQSRIFEPFYSTKPQTTGHGFGLSLVYGHVNRHHGLIHLVSSEGQGTTFRVLLPISEAEPGNESMKSAPVIPGKAMSPRSHVVIVDDQRSVVEVLQHALANAGLETTAFTSSTEALEFLADHPEVDMLLLDILMPELDGVTILQEMELKGLQIPVVVMSGFSPVTTEALSRFSAVKAVVPKPFRPEQILHLVVGMLESGRSGFEVALDSAAVVSPPVPKNDGQSG